MGTEMTPISSVDNDLQDPAWRHQSGGQVTGEILHKILQESQDKDLLLRKIEVLLRAKGLWDQIEHLLDPQVNLPEELLQRAEFKMHADADSKLELFKRLQEGITSGKGKDAIYSCEVHVDHLSVSAKRLKHSSNGPPTIGKFLSQVAMAPFSIFAKQKYTTQKILSDVSAVFEPGTSTLVLGPPGSGKSVLLKSIANKLKGSPLSFDGTIRYNGYTKQDQQFRLEKMVSYVDQIDSHIGALTVQETFQFANDCISGCNPDLIVASTHDLEEAHKMLGHTGSKVDMISRFLGLDHVKDTIVGNEMMRGVSGGQKRRVTTGEMFAGLSMCICADAVSNGLDSSTTFELIQLMKDSGNIFNFTNITVLLQPAPEVVDLFDKILLMDNGCVVFHGTKERVIEHFENMGFEIPRRKDLADFLQEVTGEDRKKYLPSDTSHLSRPIPATTAEFVERWHETPEYKATQQILGGARNESHDTARLPPVYRQEFLGSWWQSFSLCFAREWTLIRRDPMKSAVRLFFAVCLATVNAGMYEGLDKDDLGSKLGLIFQTTMFASTTAFTGLPACFEERAVFYKQRDAGYFRTSAYLFARMIAVIPIQVVETILFSSIVYFATGLTTSDGGIHFIYYLALSLAVNVSMNQFFIALSSVLPDLPTGMNMASLSFLLFILFSGYFVAKEDIPTGWLWMYYANPISWAFLAYAQNEYKSSAYDGSATGSNKRLGDQYLDQVGLSTDENYQWYALVAMFVFFIVYFLFGTLAMHHVRFIPKNSGANEEDVEEDLETLQTQVRLARQVGRRNSKKVATQRSVEENGFTPASLAWVNLSYSVDLKTRNHDGDFEQLELLHDISGYAEPDVAQYGNVWSLVLCSGFQKELQRDKLILDTMETLELGSIQNAQARTLSIEQSKRLTIGVEMVANPAILFLDEPTSGLDARAALAVVGAIRNAANTGRTIVCTIHQPSMTIFESFDSLLFLKKGGRTIFFGDLGEESTCLIDQLLTIPGSPPIGVGINPAVYMLQVAASPVLKADPSEVWLRSNRRVTLITYLDNNPGLTAPPTDGSKNPFVFKVSNSQTLTELSTLGARAFRARSPEYNVTRVVVAGTFSLIFGSVFWRDDVNTYSAMFGRMGIIFMTAMFTGFLCFTTVLPVMTSERAVFYRERAAGMYSVFSFNFTLGLVEAPYIAVVTTVFEIVLHFTVGLRPRAGTFFWYWGYCYLYFTFCTYLGQMFTAMLPNITLAQGAGFGAINIIMSFAGYIKPAGDLGALEFIYWLSPLHYAFEGMLVTQLENEPSEVTLYDPAVGEVTMSARDFVSDFFSDGAFKYEHRGYCMIVLVAFCFSTRVITGYLLKHVNHQTR